MIDKMARKLEGDTVREETQWLRIKELLDDMETKIVDHHKNNVLWGAGISDMTVEVVSKTRVGKAVLAQEKRKKEEAGTAT